MKDLRIEKTKKWIHVVVGCLLVFAVYFFGFETSYAVNATAFNKAWESFMSEYRVILAGIAGVGAVTSIMVFIFHFIKLGTMPSHPIQRRQAISNMVISAICTALLGGISTILTIFYATIFQ